MLEGKIVKEPVLRETPGGRVITDLLIAADRHYNKTDNIPCVVWGRQAVILSTAQVNQSVRLVGRVQSRLYNDNKTAYEVSVQLIEVVS